MHVSSPEDGKDLPSDHEPGTSDGDDSIRMGGGPQATLHDGEPRRGKTTGRLTNFDANDKAGLFVVPNVGPIPAANDDPDDYEETAARDIEEKVDNHTSGVTIIQLHGFTKCPNLQQALDNHSNLQPWDIGALHDDVCEASSILPPDIPDQWSEGDIRLNDYATIANQDHCPVRIAEARAKELVPNELVVTTVPKLRSWGHDADTHDDETGLEVFFDECHHVTGYYEAGTHTIDRQELDWHRDSNASGPWDASNRPSDLPKDAAKLIQRLLDDAVDHGLTYYQNDIKAQEILFRLQRLRKRIEAGDSPDQIRQSASYLLQPPDDTGEGPWNEFHQHYPDFKDRLLHSEHPDRQAIRHIVRPRRPSSFVRSRSLTYLDEVIEEWPEKADIDDTEEYWWALEGLAESPKEHDDWDGEAFGELCEWLGDQTEERLDGNPSAGDPDWEERGRFLQNLVGNEALVMPFPKRQGQDLSEIKLFGLQGQLKNWFGTLLFVPDLDVISTYRDDDTDIHLLSATPPPEKFFNRSGVPTTRAGQGGLLDPPEMKIVCELKSRSVRTWNKGKEATRFRSLVEQLDEMADPDLVFFARNGQDEQPALQEALPRPEGEDIHVARSFTSEAVQLDTDKVVTFAGPPVPSIDEEYQRRYGLNILPQGEASELKETYWGAEKIREWLAVQEVVQTIHRTAEAGEPSTGLVLSCREEFVDALRRYLDHWDYTEAEVEAVEPRKKQWRRTQEILETAEIPHEPPWQIRIQGLKIAQRLRDGGPASPTDVTRKWKWNNMPVRNLSMSGVPGSEKKQAISWAEDAGLIASNPARGGSRLEYVEG